MAVQFLQNPELEEALSLVETRKIRFRAADFYELHGQTFVPPNPKASVLLSTGTGIPQWFYTHFATNLAARGYAVMTWDYRGIGASAPESLRGLKATKRDWGRLDTSAALARCKHEFPDIPLFVFGHSVGGQLLGITKGVELIDGVATYGSGFGYWGEMPQPYGLFVASLWYVTIPVLSRAFGYMPAKLLGLGEDLPAGVAQDWARWGRRRTYFKSELEHETGFRLLDAPFKAFVASDDDIARGSNVDLLYEMFATDIETEVLQPADFGLDSLGHIEFFSRRRKSAWRVVPDYFDSLLDKPAR